MEKFNISKTDSIASAILTFLFALALIFIDVYSYFINPPIYALIFINLILICLFIYTIYRIQNVFFDEFIVSQDRMIQIKHNKKVINIRWAEITKVTYNCFDIFLYLYGDNKKITIYIRTNKIERLIKIIRDHLDNELTQKALYNLEASSFISLK